MSREKLNKTNPSKRAWVLNKMADDLIYSPDWFPAKQKKTPSRKDVKALLKEVKRAQLSPILEMKQKTRWARVFEQEEATLLAAKQELANSTDEQEKVLLREEIAAITQRLHNARRILFSLAKKGNGNYSEGLSITDKKNLWDAWYQTQIEQYGEVKLSRSKFSKMFYQQCFRQIYPKALEKAEEAKKAGKISEKEMRARLKKVKTAIWRRVNQKADEIYNK